MHKSSLHVIHSICPSLDLFLLCFVFVLVYQDFVVVVIPVSKIFKYLMLLIIPQL